RIAAVEAEVAPLHAASAAVRMARSRARRALAATLQVASAVATAVAVSWRALGRGARTSATSLGVVATMAFVLGVSGWVGSHPAPLRSGQPIVAVAVPAGDAVAPHPSAAARDRHRESVALAPSAHRTHPTRVAPYYYIGPGAA